MSGRVSLRISHPLAQRLKIIFRLSKEPSDNQELIEQLGLRWLKLPNDLRQLLSAMFTHFMKHAAWPTMEELAHLQGKPLSEVKDVVERAERTPYVQRDVEHDRYFTRLWVGSHRTAHEVQAENGMTVYAACAVDALWIFSFTMQSGTIRSACPHCGARLSVRFEHGKIVKSEPEEFLLFLGVKMAGEGDVGELGCPFENLFPDMTHISSWLSQTHGVDGVHLTREETEKLTYAVASGQEQPLTELG